MIETRIEVSGRVVRATGSSIGGAWYVTAFIRVVAVLGNACGDPFWSIAQKFAAE
jgi:hypothetical protein